MLCCSVLWCVVLFCVVCCFTVSLPFNAYDVTTLLAPDAPSPRRIQNNSNAGPYSAHGVGRAVVKKENSAAQASNKGCRNIWRCQSHCAVGILALILLKASRATVLITPEHGVLILQSDREVHAAQFQHHVIPRYWATECEGCTIFQQIGMYAPARTCITPNPREFPTLLPLASVPKTFHPCSARKSGIPTFPSIVEMPTGVWFVLKVTARRFCTVPS